MNKEIQISIPQELYIKTMREAIDEHSGDLDAQMKTIIEYFFEMKEREKIKINFHTDAGHGWYAVNIRELVKLGIADSISFCSYQRGSTIYLEEDRDAEIYFTAKMKSLGYDPENDPSKHHAYKDKLFKITVLYKERSQIRGYSSYRPNTVLHDRMRRMITSAGGTAHVRS